MPLDLTYTTIAQPSRYELTGRALASDFFDELSLGITRDDLSRFAEIAIDIAADTWEHDVGAEPGRTVTSATRCLALDDLIRLGSKVISMADDAAEGAVQEAIEIGELVARRY